MTESGQPGMRSRQSSNSSAYAVIFMNHCGISRRSTSALIVGNTKSAEAAASEMPSTARTPMERKPPESATKKAAKPPAVVAVAAMMARPVSATLRRSAPSSLERRRMAAVRYTPLSTPMPMTAVRIGTLSSVN